MAAALAAKVLPFDLFETRRLVGALRRHRRVDRDMANWPPPRRPGRRTDRAHAACDLPALLRPHVHQCRKMRRSPPPWRCCCSAWSARFEEYPRPSARTVALQASAWDLLSARASLRASPRPMRSSPCSSSWSVKHATRMASERRRVSANSSGGCVPALALGYLIMGLLWPWSILSPLNPVRAAEYFDTVLRETVARILRRQDNLGHRHAGGLSAASLRAQAARNHAGAGTRRGWPVRFLPRPTQLPLNRRASLLLVALAAILPVAWQSWRIPLSTMACAISCSSCRHLQRSVALPAHGFSRGPTLSARSRRPRS